MASVHVVGKGEEQSAKMRAAGSLRRKERRSKPSDVGVLGHVAASACRKVPSESWTGASFTPMPAVWSSVLRDATTSSSKPVQCFQLASILTLFPRAQMSTERRSKWIQSCNGRRRQSTPPCAVLNNQSSSLLFGTPPPALPSNHFVQPPPSNFLKCPSPNHD